MTRDELRQSIIENLRVSNLHLREISVQRDPLGGWRIAVVSPDFEGKTHQERRNAALNNLDVQVEWIDLLTPDEREWVGTLPADLEVEQLPLWPQALAASSDEPHLFPSDLDEDLPLPIRATFYSLRGGVGRSTALAYTARLLGARGRKVVCIDMDLEAPGLAALFGQEDRLNADQGVVAALLAFERGEEPDLSRHLIRVSESDDVYCIPAGTPTAEYAHRLAQLDPASWYREEANPLRRFVDAVENKLPFKPDVVLIDARTGITPLSAPLLFDIADLAVVVFFPHPQAALGTAALVRALLAAHTRRLLNGRALTPEPRFIVSPIPASKVPEVVQKYRHRALEWIGDWLSSTNTTSANESGFVESEITHFVPYRESLATADSVVLNEDAAREFGPVAEWIERFLPTRSERALPVVHDRKAAILGELRVSAGTAEEQDNLLETFVETDTVKEALDPNTPLVLGRKGTGKTAIFRRLKEDNTRIAVVVQAPSGLVGDKRWVLGPDGFREVDLVLQKHTSSWRQFWAYYTHLAVRQSELPGAKADAVAVASDVNRILEADVVTELDVVRNLDRLLQIPNAALLLNERLDRQDSAQDKATILLFDGLDTGFGIAEGDRHRRARAIEGLFAFWTDRGERLTKLRFKILLREDIWRNLAFENKSHLFGRTVALKWADQAAFFKVVMKQAARSSSFRQQLSTIPGGDRWASSDIDYWSEQEVFAAWNILVGERMKGGKTTFTRNWVWNRLADANDDHSPRYLLQLFAVASEWEKAEQRRTPYDRSIIRPRALIASLPDVSEQALDALSREEFPELSELLKRLRETGRTPVSADVLEGVSGVGLALEVGVLGEYEISIDNVLRYRVPEIYRYALNMTRKGQA